ncbi:MAG: hypothetical protein F7B20_07825 [Aeropyrum sp.]|nr:hypothetical protein [Aeropyrum sp.]MCE4616629.1 hypothetical protein [Aeropyrum sp.]
MNPSEKLGLALLTFISSPAKPGAPHRLLASRDFESALTEAYVVAVNMREAYKLGVQLAQGSRDAKSIGLGRLISASIMQAFDYTGNQPTPGLHAGMLTLALLAGVSEKESRRPSSSLGVLARRILYHTSPSDAAALLDALEATGSGIYVEMLERENIRRTTILAYGTTLGEVFEVLQDLDLGFSANIKGYTRILHVSKEASKAKNLVSASLLAYLHVLREYAGVDAGEPSVKELLKLDSKLRREGFNWRRYVPLAAMGLSLAYLETPIPTT